MKLKVLSLFIVCILQCGILLSARAEVQADSSKKFKLANLVQSNMVVQQKKPFQIWGVAPVGDAVQIQADWMKKPITINADAEGNWTGQIKVPAAIQGDFGAHKITVIHQQDIITLTNILIGEVWVCSGQSNMEMRVGMIKGWGTGIKDYEKELAIAHYPNIRFFKPDMGIEFEPLADCKGKWEVCDPKTTATFSAVGYFFGRELFNKLQIPIGLVDAAIPATACQAFVEINILQADTVFKKKYVDPYLPGIKAIKEKNDKKTTITTLEYPGLVYNKMIHPLKNLSIAGFTWYQGESNNKDTLLYTRLCTAMLNGWRNDFKQGDLPFYFVQMPPYSWGKKDSTAVSYAKFRENQETMLKEKNIGMAVTMDVGEPNNIHPLNKKPVGIRLAKAALYKTYKMHDMVYMGPKFSKFKQEKDTLKVSFVSASIGSGLTTNDGKAPKYFFVAGPNKVFHKATARIVGKEIWIYSAEVHEPVAVRYAFTNYPVTNFENKEGLPAMPFRTDNWSN